jgi:hypothetical protein
MAAVDSIPRDGDQLEAAMFQDLNFAAGFHACAFPEHARP